MCGVEEPVGEEAEDEVDEAAGKEEWVTGTGHDQEALQDAISDSDQ